MANRPFEHPGEGDGSHYCEQTGPLSGRAPPSPESTYWVRGLTSTEHAIYFLLQRIHQAWSEGKVASLLLLDVSGAYDNVSRERLLHNLRKRRIDPKIIAWIASFLADRTTTLKLQEFILPSAPIQTGIPKGSPVSPILYLFYNADLIETCWTEDTEAVGYIDDASAVGPTTQRNCKTLKKIHRQAEQWATKRIVAISTSFVGVDYMSRYVFGLPTETHHTFGQAD